MNLPESQKPLDENLSRKPQPKQFDNIYFGLFTGFFVAPFIGFWIFYLLAITRNYGYDMTPSHYFGLATSSAEVFSKIMAFSCIPNLALFFLLLRTQRDTAARGVIFATLLYVGVVIILKFF